MLQFSMAYAFMLACLVLRSMAGPVEVEKSSSDDLSTSETYGYGYYQPSYQPAVYSTPLVATGVPVAPVTTTTTLGTASGGYAKSGYGYGSGYKYGSGYDFGKRWGYGTGGAVNEFYRRHPVYVAWG